MQVKDDILQCLNMKNPLIYSVPVFRPNLYYDIRFLEILDKPFEHLKKFILESLGSQDESISKVNVYNIIIICSLRIHLITSDKKFEDFIDIKFH